MYKTELIHNVAQETHLSQRVVSDALNAALRQITARLAEAEKVTLPGFGVFYTRYRAPSAARSFRTGRSITVPGMRLASFRVGDQLKRAVRATGRRRLWGRRPR